jgi:hypothetical protein
MYAFLADGLVELAAEYEGIGSVGVH